MNQNSKKDKIVGVVGLGLMGSSITTALATSGYHVVAVAPISSDLEKAPDHLKRQLTHALTLKILEHPVNYYQNRITLTEDYTKLEDCSLVIECVIEDRDIKAAIYERIEAEVSEKTIIGTNTSAIPISSLQEYISIPHRFMGIHWAEPAYATKFLEITCGSKTDVILATKVSKWAEDWNKEPTLLRKDIRGFITNRLMYAVYREALSLECQGVATLKKLDKAARYDMGSWIPLMGLFQRMDYMGLEEELKKTQALLPILSNTPQRPAIMEDIVRSKDRGVHTGKGLYNYTTEEAEKWQKTFSQFNRDMYFLSEKYAENKTPTKEESNKK